MENGYSLADIASAIGNKNCDWGNNGGMLWIIILFLFCFMGGGNGFFGRNNNCNDSHCATTEDVQNQFNFSALERQMNEGRAETIASEGNLTGTIKDMGYNNLANQKETQQMVYGLQSSFDRCCCETNRNIDSIRYENAMNTCKITTAIHEDGEKTRAMMQENLIQNLRDRVSELSLAQSQCNQNAYLLNMLRLNQPSCCGTLSV